MRNPKIIFSYLLKKFITIFIFRCIEEITHRSECVGVQTQFMTFDLIIIYAIFFPGKLKFVDAL